MTVRPIPLPEPEVIEADRRRNPVDPGCTFTPLQGPMLFSRHALAVEMEFLSRVVETMPPSLLQSVTVAFADSRTSHCWEFSTKPVTPGEGELIAGHVAAKARQVFGGFTAVRVLMADVGVFDIGPEWPPRVLQ